MCAVKKTAVKKTAKKIEKVEQEKKEFFKKHLKKIENAKEQTQQIMAFDEESKNIKYSLNLVWNCLFDFFYRTDKEDISVASLNTIAGLINKLASTGEYLENDSGNAGISAEALVKIEEKLKLL